MCSTKVKQKIIPRRIDTAVWHVCRLLSFCCPFKYIRESKECCRHSLVGAERMNSACAVDDSIDSLNKSVTHLPFGLERAKTSECEKKMRETIHQRRKHMHRIDSHTVWYPLISLNFDKSSVKHMQNAIRDHAMPKQAIFFGGNNDKLSLFERPVHASHVEFSIKCRHVRCERRALDRALSEALDSRIYGKWK